MFTYVSPSWTNILGHNVAEVEGHSFKEFVHPDDLSACLAFLQQVIESGLRKDGVTYRVRHINGHWHWHTTSASPTRNVAGNITGFVGLARDITELKQVEQTLKMNEANFRAFFESSQDMIVVGSPGDQVLYANEAIKTKLGYSEEELKGLGILGIHPADRRM